MITRDVIITMTSFNSAGSNALASTVITSFPFLCGFLLLLPLSLYLGYPWPTPVAIATKFETRWVISRLVEEISLWSLRSSSSSRRLVGLLHFHLAEIMHFHERLLVFFTVNTITHESLNLAWWIFFEISHGHVSWQPQKILLNFKVIGHKSKSQP